jgi:hypothetical protein
MMTVHGYVRTCGEDANSIISLDYMQAISIKLFFKRLTGAIRSSALLTKHVASLPHIFSVWGFAVSLV